MRRHVLILVLISSISASLMAGSWPQWRGPSLDVAPERATGLLELWAVDRNPQNVTWKPPLSGGNKIGNKQNMSSPSPVTDGRSVWVMTGTGVLKAFTLEGKELWTRDIQKDYGAFGIQFGYASSPLLHDSELYLQ